LDCCRLDRGVVESPDNPVVAMGVRVRRTEARPDDGPVGKPPTLVGARAAAAGTVVVEIATGRLACLGGLGGVNGDVASTKSVCSCSRCCATGEDVFRGVGVKKSRRFLGLEGVSSPDGGDGGKVVATSAVGDTGVAATEGGVVWSLAAGPGGDGLNDSVDVVPTSCRGCGVVDEDDGPCPSGC
jgi:hypothetical protein